MEFKGVFIVALLAYCAQVTVAFPRSNFIVKEEEIEIVTDRTDEKLTTEQIIEHTESREPVSVPHSHQVVQCAFEEVTEDTVCKEHCLPKGYSYGLCVGHRCSCV